MNQFRFFARTFLYACMIANAAMVTFIFYQIVFLGHSTAYEPIRAIAWIELIASNIALVYSIIFVFSSGLKEAYDYGARQQE